MMKERDVRLNVITLDFANELGQDDDSESDKENVDEIAEELLEMTDSKKKGGKEQIGPVETVNQTSNKDFLVNLTSTIKGAIFPASVAMEVCKQFKKREVMSRSRYRGTFDVAEDLKLGVQIYPRTREETFPTLKKFSKVAERNNAASAAGVTLQRTYTEVDDAD